MGEKVFDKVKYEKAKAMARFKLFQRIKTVWKVLILGILIWSLKSTPVPVGFAGKVLFRVSDHALSPCVVFIVGNAIVVVLFLLGRKGGSGNTSGDFDLYDDYVGHSEAQRGVGSDSEIEAESSEMEESVKEDNGIVGSEAEEKEMQNMVTENAQCEAVEAVIAEATEQIRRFERTQSEKLRREIRVKPQKVLRRAETEMQRRLVISSGEEAGSVTSSSVVERVHSLSNEEFKLAIDAYIDKHREFFYIQKVQELKKSKEIV